MIVTPSPLNHAGSESTAFLIESGGDAIMGSVQDVFLIER
jgi:3',5'-cyclic-nucleotide phosphodiesterase